MRSGYESSDPTWLRLVRVVFVDLDDGVGEVDGVAGRGGAGVVVGPDLHDVVAAGSTNESVDAPTRFSLEIVLIVVGPRRPT